MQTQDGQSPDHQDTSGEKGPAGRRSGEEGPAREGCGTADWQTRRMLRKSIPRTKRLAEAGTAASVRSVGDSYGNAP
jgi:hypothetical protein